jgi:type II secretory pathway pseudopilin PulG
MSFDNLDTDDDVSSDIEDEGGTPEEASNRTFLIVAGVFGAIVVLSLICLVLFVVFKVLPDRNNASKEATQAAQRNIDIMKGVTQTALAQMWTATPTQTFTPVPVTPTRKPSDTPVIKPSSTPTSPNEATIAALRDAATKTRLALDKITQTVTPQATSLGDTGFADQVGAPALLGLAAVLIVVIFLARRLRTANS